MEARPPRPGYRLRKFARRHKGQVVAASLVLLSLVLGMVGTTWGLIRAERANTALAAANTDLTVANAKVHARYDLAVDAIKTFHTGVSEDFLLKQNQFKELRDRLLKSAADFYGKLSALLGNETDIASRRALAAANFELADLTDKVGRKDEALAAHRAVLAAKKALDCRSGSQRRGKRRCRSQPDSRRNPSRGIRQDSRRRGDLSRGRGFTRGPGGFDAVRRASRRRTGRLPLSTWISAVQYWPRRRRPAGPPPGAV